MRRREAEHFPGLLEARVLPKAREQFVQARVKWIALGDLLGPAFKGPEHHALLHRSSVRLRVGLPHRAALGGVRHALEQPAAQNGVKLGAVETDRRDVQRAAANLLVGIVDRLLDAQAALAPDAGEVADNQTCVGQPSAHDGVHEVGESQGQAVGLGRARSGRLGAEADKEWR